MGGQPGLGVLGVPCIQIIYYQVIGRLHNAVGVAIAIHLSMSWKAKCCSSWPVYNMNSNYHGFDSNWGLKH